ncbi:MAG: hypothetical protein DMF06_14295 [Verrucomicrobia bacterium]|nr:MAG: hypothetical protein DMF06_14295 [Verrucomicrobiota bacterium]
MTTLTSSATFSIGDATTVIEQADIVILPVASVGQGRGRLVHPVLGTYDYLHAPDEWTNLDGDVIISPIWSSSKTLSGSSNTLWMGDIRDTVVEEKWTGALSASLTHLRALLAMWQMPPDPAADYVEWWPSYANALGYKVLLIALEVGGQAISLNYVARQGWVAAPITLRLKIAERI